MGQIQRSLFSQRINKVLISLQQPYQIHSAAGVSSHFVLSYVDMQEIEFHVFMAPVE